MSKLSFYLRGICLWLSVIGSQTFYSAVVREGADWLWLAPSLGLSIAFWALLENTAGKRGEA